MTKDLLKEELETYEKEKQNLISKHNGKYVLIKSKSIIKIFESQNDAIKEGIRLYGNQPFLVKKIEAVEQTQNFASNLINVRV